MVSGLRVCAGAAAKAKKNRKSHAKSTSKNIEILLICFTFFRAGRPSRKNAPKMTSQSHSGTLPGSLRGSEIDKLFAPGGPQAANNDFFGSPGPSQSPGRLRGGSGSRGGAQGPPRGLQGSILEPFWLHFGQLLLVFSTLRRFIFNVSGDQFSPCFLRVFLVSKQPLATKRLAKKGWSAVLAEP